MIGGREDVLEMLQAMADGEFYKKYRVLRTGEIERKEEEEDGEQSPISRRRFQNRNGA